MPIKETNFEVYYLNNNNEYEKIGKVSDFTVDLQSDDNVSEEFQNNFGVNKYGDFSLMIAINHKTKKILTKLIFGTNNWRRRHGLPMKSCKRYQHEKR